MVTESEHLLVECNHGIATLTLNRLQQHNAFDANLIKELQKTLDEFAQDSSIRVIKINANGKYFCAVYDRRFGKWRTVSGKEFECVPIREKIAKGESWPGDEHCGYKKFRALENLS